MSETLTAAHFTPDSADAWTVHLADGQSVALHVRQTEVRGEPRPFLVRFTGPLEPQLAQATFDVEHASVGHTALFLVPIGRTEDAMHYEAVFG